MPDETENQFAGLPVGVRLEILSALQEVVMVSTSKDRSQRALDTIVRLGYPGTAESALHAREAMAARL